MNIRPTHVTIDSEALQHNIMQIKTHTSQKIIAMVKANAYGCGLSMTIPTLSPLVDAFGVASLIEAIAVKQFDKETPCILFQGIFDVMELPIIMDQDIECVVHQIEQLNWILSFPLPKPIKVWVKVDTGMHRLGFNPLEVHDVLSALNNCAWIEKPIGLMTHFASADHEDLTDTIMQLEIFDNLDLDGIPVIKTAANSAALLKLPQSHYDVVRPGIMMYGVSPFADKTGAEFGLKPIMRFVSAISSIHDYPAGSKIGYGGSYVLESDARIGTVSAGYGDGYPRHVKNGVVWINHCLVPIVGIISMDTLAVDLSHFHNVKIGDLVELWGPELPIEHVAITANTIAYELLCQITTRGRGI